MGDKPDFTQDLDYEMVEEKLTDWIHKKVKKAGMQGGVIGLSGGIDSAVTAVLCKKVFPDNCLTVILPCASEEQDLQDARMLVDKFNFDSITKDVTPVFERLLETLAENPEEQNKLSVANIKPRLRMTVLYYYASENNYLVIGTDNWSELKVGYFTKYGDGGVDIAPLGSLVKTEVRQLARYLDIPEKIINKPPSAGLWEGQTDEEEMGISYEVLDRYILSGKASPAEKEIIQELEEKNKHKLETLPIPNRNSFNS